MKIIRIFVASSVTEFEKERIYIGDSIRRHNDCVLNQGYQLRLYLCEDEYFNSQPIYDRNILKSDIFVAIIGDKLGEFTKHEICDVADKCRSIKKKFLVLKSLSSQDFLPHNIESDFIVVNSNYAVVDTVSNIINNSISDVLPLLPDDENNLYLNHFNVNLPTLDIIEYSVISNVIRRLRDQGNGITLSDQPFLSSQDAYIALLSEKYDLEIDRIDSMLESGISEESLWVFAHQAIIESKDSDIRLSIEKLYSILKGYYFDSYTSYNVLSIIFQNKLLGALMQNNILDGSGFTYKVEDHWLVRKGISQRSDVNFINLLNTGYEPESDDQMRKERIIVNLLNHYWLNGETEKHLKALEALQNADYDFFKYSYDDLDELQLNRVDYKQAVVDYIFDNLESLQLMIGEIDGPEALSRVYEILEVLEDAGKLTEEKRFGIYYFAANILSCYGLIMQETLSFYQCAWDCFRKIIKPDLIIKEYAKQCIVRMCSICEEYSNDSSLTEWIKEGETLIDDDLEYRICILLHKKDLYQNTNCEKEEECISELRQLFQTGIVEKSNTQLSLYIYFEYNLIWNDIANINEHTDIINLLINLCCQYLVSDEKYSKICLSVFSLAVLLGDNLEDCDSIINQYKKKMRDDDKSKDYYNLLFAKAWIIKKKGNALEAINLLKKLIGLYRGKRDVACCWQNIALCYMDIWKGRNSLVEAETAYMKSREFFCQLEDKKKLANVYDGLSYCYILQKRFKEAEDYAYKAISISEYSTSNKYCNYISSLLCQGRFDFAKDFYSKCNDKDGIRKNLLVDWNTEMQEIGIDTTSFYHIFD